MLKRTAILCFLLISQAFINCEMIYQTLPHSSSLSLHNFTHNEGNHNRLVQQQCACVDCTCNNQPCPLSLSPTQTYYLETSCSYGSFVSVEKLYFQSTENSGLKLYSVDEPNFLKLRNGQPFNYVGAKSHADSAYTCIADTMKGVRIAPKAYVVLICQNAVMSCSVRTNIGTKCEVAPAVRAEAIIKSGGRVYTDTDINISMELKNMYDNIDTLADGSLHVEILSGTGATGAYLTGNVNPSIYRGTVNTAVRVSKAGRGYKLVLRYNTLGGEGRMEGFSSFDVLEPEQTQPDYPTQKPTESYSPVDGPKGNIILELFAAHFFKIIGVIIVLVIITIIVIATVVIVRKRNQNRRQQDRHIELQEEVQVNLDDIHEDETENK